MNREEAIEILKNMVDWETPTEKREIYSIRKQVEAITMGIKSLKNQKTGHWIVDLQNTIGGLYKCSECGRRIYLFREDNLSENYPYCHCGAKMEGE